MIITLCGSTKFMKEFIALNYWLTLNNHIVLSVGGYYHSDNDPHIKEEIIMHKEQLDKLHKTKIMMSDAILVIDKDNYIGESTKSEIQFARENNKSIYWYYNGSYLSLGDTA